MQSDTAAGRAAQDQHLPPATMPGAGGTYRPSAGQHSLALEPISFMADGTPIPTVPGAGQLPGSCLQGHHVPFLCGINTRRQPVLLVGLMCQHMRTARRRPPPPSCLELAINRYVTPLLIGHDDMQAIPGLGHALLLRPAGPLLGPVAPHPHPCPGHSACQHPCRTRRRSRPGIAAGLQQPCQLTDAYQHYYHCPQSMPQLVHETRPPHTARVHTRQPLPPLWGVAGTPQTTPRHWRPRPSPPWLPLLRVFLWAGTGRART
jgi:hypothetical protein